MMQFIMKPGIFLQDVILKGNILNTMPQLCRSIATSITERPHNEPDKSPSSEPDKLYRMIELEMRGHDPAVLKSYSYFLNTAARLLDVEVGKCWTPKKAVHERLTLLRSIHVKKKYRVQYETRTYFTFAQLHKLTGSTADTLLEYIQRNLPEGISMKVTKVGLERIPEHIKPPAHEEVSAQ